MDVEQIEGLMDAINCANVFRADNGWVRSTCPLAPFLHAGGKDTNPSFGIQSVIGGANFHCFTCLSGTVESLVDTLDIYLNNGAHDYLKPYYDLEAARLIVENKALNVHKLPDYEIINSSKSFEEWPLWFKDQFSSAYLIPRALDYLMLERGLSREEVIRWDFRYDLQRDMVLFPFYDAYGRFAGMRGRKIGAAKGEKRFHDYSCMGVNNTMLCWGNESCFQAGEPVVVVEGQFDLIKVARVYPYVVANLTAKVTTQKLKKLLDCPAIILMQDNDATGIAAREKAAEFLQKNGALVGVAEYNSPEPDNASEEEIRDALKGMVNI